MTQQFGFRASRNLAEVLNRDECWDNLGIDRRDLALLVDTSAAGVTENDYFNCKDLTTFLEPQVSGLSVGAASGLTAMSTKISKNGDIGVGTLSGATVDNDRAYSNVNFDIISASTNSFFSPVTSAGYSAGAQYLLGPVSIPSLTISGFNFRGQTRAWSNYFVKYRNYLRLVDSGSTVRYSPLYLAPPASLASNVLWLDSEFSAITLEAGAVKRWDDVLLRANAGQSDATYRPTVLTSDVNGKPGINFDGGGDFLNIGSIGGAMPTAATLIVALSISNASGGGDVVYSVISSLANISSAWRSGSGNGAWGLFTAAIISNFPTSMPANGTLIMSVRASNVYGLELRINGQRQSFRAPGSYAYSNAGNFVIGVSDSISRSNAFRGSIHSIAFYNETLSDTELNSQEEYFRWRFGFVLDPDAASLSFTKVLHDEQVNEFTLENDDTLEVD